MEKERNPTMGKMCVGWRRRRERYAWKRKERNREK